MLRQVSRYIHKLEELLRGRVLVVHYLGYHHLVLAATILRFRFLLIVAGIISTTLAIAVECPRFQLLPAIMQLYQHPRYGGEIDKQ